MKTNLNFWNRLCNAGFGPREDDRSSVLGGFLQIEPWNRLSASSAMLIAGLCLLFLGTFASQASAQDIDQVLLTDTLDYSAYAHSSDSVWLKVTLAWDFEGCMSCPDDQSSSSYVVISINGNFLAVYTGGETYNSWLYETYGLGDPPILVPDSDLTSPMIVTLEWYDNETDYYASQWWWAGSNGVGVTAVHAGKGMALGRTSISLGQVRIGSPKADTLRVSSIGTDSITVSSGMKTGTLFSRYPTSANRTINAGTSEIDSVIFAPTARGTFSDSLIVTSNSDEVSEHRMAVYVSGQGVQAAFNSINGNTLAFGNLHVDSSVLQMFYFSNTGDDTLFLQWPTISGTGFSLAWWETSFTLPPNQTDSTLVRFYPSQWRSYSETMQFTASNGVSVPSITITGAGILPRIQVSNSQALGQARVGQTVQRTVTFRNTGNDTLHLANATLAQTSTRFTLGAHDQVVLPGATGTFQITYAPNQRNLDNAKLLFTTDDPSHLADTIRVSGQGIQAIFTSNHGTDSTKLDFGNVHVGRTEERTFAFSNSGDDTLFLQLPTIVGSMFSIVSEPANLVLLPHQAGSVVMQFAPTVENFYVGTLSFTASNGVSAPTVTLNGIGALPHMAVANNHETVDLGQVKVNTIASRRFAVANNGAWDLTLTSPTASPSPFSIGTWPTVVAGNTTGYVAVNFAPTATGSFRGMLVIAGDDASNPSDTILLTGTGIESALSIDPVNVDFGMVPISSIVRDTIILSNTGTASVNINSYTLSPQAGTFAIGNSQAAQISAGGTARVIVSFRPNAEGNYAGTLTLTTDDGGTPVRTINLSGTGVKGILSVASSIDFGNVNIGQDSTIQATLTNTGQASVTINSLTMTGSAFSNGTFATPVTIAAGETVNLDLTFTPTIGGNATGTVRVTLGDNTLVNIALSGVGLSSDGVRETSASGNEFSLSISPNPANRIATAHISVIKAVDGQLTVFDVTGHEVLSLPLGLLSEGAHDVSLPIEHLASGSYFVRITNASGASASARLVLAR